MRIFDEYALTELAQIKLKSTKTTKDLFCNEIYLHNYNYNATFVKPKTKK